MALAVPKTGFTSILGLLLGKTTVAMHRSVRFITPSFLTKGAPSIDRPTDFLDGMRGFASFIVFVWHCVYPIYANPELGFWSNQGRANDHYFTQLPIIRLVYSGHVCMLLFFVISGFSISLKPLRLAREGAHEALFAALASAVLRRTSRLYLPCIAITFMVFLLVCLGGYNYATALVEVDDPKNTYTIIEA